MNYFDRYVSNTTAGCGNQFYFVSDDLARVRVGRVYLKPYVNGAFAYSLLYTNIIDTTFSDGSVGHANLVCDEWTVDALRAAVVSSCDPNAADRASFVRLTFGGSGSKTAAPGEFFCTDPFLLSPAEGEWICIEITYHGRQIPCHPECQIPVYHREDGEWRQSAQCPLPAMVGCERTVAARVGFLGDSITQGIGATFNSYRHYAAATAERLGTAYSYWDLGLGFARAADAATDGAWLFKAKQLDTVTVCLGVNDINSGRTAEMLKSDLRRTVTALKSAGVRVLLQTVPPFDYDQARERVWREVNAYIEQELSVVADAVFRTHDFLGEPTAPARAKYGGHPDDAGCALWADRLAPVLRSMLAE